MSCEFPLYLPIGDMENDGFIAVPRRPLTTQEVEWVTEIVLISPQWADVSLGSLYVIRELRLGASVCGVREAGAAADSSSEPVIRAWWVKSISQSYTGGKKEPLTILLHYADGSLSLLEADPAELPRADSPNMERGKPRGPSWSVKRLSCFFTGRPLEG